MSNQLQAKVEQQLVDFPGALEAVEGCFDHFTKPFAGLESHYKQQNFFRGEVWSSSKYSNL